MYLLFSPDELIPLDKFVFTTEAHPMQVYDGSEIFKQRDARRAVEIEQARIEEANRVANDIKAAEEEAAQERLKRDIQDAEVTSADPFRDEDDMQGRIAQMLFKDN